MAKEQPHMESASQPTSFLLARSCSITSSLPAANVMHPSAALCAGPSCSSVASGRTPVWAAVTPACTAQGRVVTHSRFGEGSRHALGLVLAVGVTSMYSVITGRRVNLLSLGPSLYSVTRSTASATYDSGARNSSGCSCGVIGVDAAAAASGCRGAISTRSVSGRFSQVTCLVATRCKITEEHREEPQKFGKFERKFHAFPRRAPPLRRFAEFHAIAELPLRHRFACGSLPRSAGALRSALF